MRLSNYFLPILKENPTEAKIVSHRLMLRSGMVRQAGAGLYNWLPLGHRVLQNISNIIREELEKSGALEMLMPTIQSAQLWQESGRLDDYGQEMLRIQDRHGRDFLYGPTNEEQITQIVRDNVQSYKSLPCNLYHIQWKFRDEIRPRFGVMRGREFLMKDGYSFDIDEEKARVAYQKMFVAYLKIFQRLGLKALPMAADTGPIGGDLSHEFIILAQTGESEVYCHGDVLNCSLPDDLDYESDLMPIIKTYTDYYAATDEKYDAKEFEESVPKEKRIKARGIEVGHIFYFGQKYTIPMKCKMTNVEGKEVPLYCGSYGIGVSRLVGGIIEACHDEAGIVWPQSVAPYDVGIINLKTGNADTDKICEDIYQKLKAHNIEVLYDDSDMRAGAKFSTMDLIGLPWQIIVGPSGAKLEQLELKSRITGERETLGVEAVFSKIIQNYQ